MNQENELLKQRHSLSHLMSMAVQELYPQVGLGVGPAIENGFYQDYDLPEEITPEILPKLEKRMRELIKKNIEFKQHDVDYAEAYKFYEHDPYKTEFIDDLKAKGEKQVSFYKSDWFDNLCGGPHVSSTKEINPTAFKLDHIAGAYWRGDEKNKMLTRIYGLAFESKEALKAHIEMIEEAKKRDHRKLGKELSLFTFSENVGLGLPLWMPKGALLFKTIEDFWNKSHLENGYDFVRSPHIGNKKLREKSGHRGFYSSSMYPPMEAGQTLEEQKEGKKVEESEQYLLKPMNCPFHVEIYNTEPKSYRELPLRRCETGTVYRFEKKGQLSGLTRVRGFTQDDAHIICRKDQVEDELQRVVNFILFIYQSFGFKKEDVKVYLSLRDPINKEKYAGNDAGREFTQKVLKKVADDMKLDYTTEEGEAAFYGPKLDFKVKDCLGRERQCSTLQFDFNLPERFDMTFVNEKGEKERPYMLHRALLGSFERFIGVLIEHYAGAFPFWLAPVQIKVIPVAKNFTNYADKIYNQFKQNGFRISVDDSDDSFSKKIRNGEIQKIPYLIIVGEKEESTNTLSIREYSSKKQYEIPVEEFLNKRKEEIKI